MPALPALALGVAAIGTGYSIYAGERANKAGKKATKLEQQRNKLAEARQKRDAVRAARQSYAQAQAAGENQGVSSSSAASGGQSSIVSQLSGEMSFLDQYGFLSDQASKALGKAQSWNNSARMGAAVSDAAMTVFSNAGEISQAYNKVFKRGP